MPARAAQAMMPCCIELRAGSCTMRIIGRMMPTSVESAAPVSWPSDATMSTRKCPQRSGMVSMSTGWPSGLPPMRSRRLRKRFHTSMSHSRPMPTPTPTADSQKRSVQFISGETWGVICDTSRMISMVMVAMWPLL